MSPPPPPQKILKSRGPEMPFPAFSCHGCNSHLALRFVSKMYLLIVLILPESFVNVISFSM